MLVADKSLIQSAQDLLSGVVTNKRAERDALNDIYEPFQDHIAMGGFVNCRFCRGK